MLFCFEEYDKYAEITGFKNVKFVLAEEFLRKSRGSQQAVDIQFFDADLIATDQHLYFAVLNALNSFRNRTNISNSLAMETMLYASAQRQIKKAIELCGIKKESVNMAVVIIGDNAKEANAALNDVVRYDLGKIDAGVLALSKEKTEKIKKSFQISDKEMQTVMKNKDSELVLVSIVIERVALLATQL